MLSSNCGFKSRDGTEYPGFAVARKRNWLYHDRQLNIKKPDTISGGLWFHWRTLQTRKCDSIGSATWGFLTASPAYARAIFPASQRETRCGHVTSPCTQLLSSGRQWPATVAFRINIRHGLQSQPMPPGCRRTRGSFPAGGFCTCRGCKRRSGRSLLSLHHDFILFGSRQLILARRKTNAWTTMQRKALSL